MSENTTEFDFEQQRKKWLKRLAGEMERAEKPMPVKFLPEGVEHPQWVENVERELALVLLPAAKLREANYVVTPRRMGALIGHGCGMAVWMRDWIIQVNQGAAGDAFGPLAETEQQRTQLFLLSIGTWYDAMRRLAKLSLCSSVDQTYDDMTGFLSGYGDGFARKPKTFKAGEMGNPTFEIYVFMIWHWRVIEQLKSVPQLHETLTKVFGASRIGEQKRIEKICQRIELSFRKPGRPTKK